jgi:hypothetical protein
MRQQEYRQIVRGQPQNLPPTYTHRHTLHTQKDKCACARALRLGTGGSRCPALVLEGCHVGPRRHCVIDKETGRGKGRGEEQGGAARTLRSSAASSASPRASRSGLGAHGVCLSAQLPSPAFTSAAAVCNPTTCAYAGSCMKTLPPLLTQTLASNPTTCPYAGSCIKPYLS